MRRISRWLSDSFTALFAGVVFLPGLVGVATAAVYFTDWPSKAGREQLGIGLALGLAGWLVLSLLFLRGWGRAETANVDAYDELRVRLASLKGRVPAEAETPALLVDGRLSPAGEAVRIAREHERLLEAALAPGAGGRGLRWLTQSGYVNLWRSVHRAEEALLALAPAAQLHVVAVQDRARLRTAPVEGQKELLAELDRLLETKEAAAKPARDGGGARAEALFREVLHAVAVGEPAGTRKPALSEAVALLEQPAGGGNGSGKGSASEPFADPRAQALVREVRYSLDQRRNDLWDRIVHLRNLMLTTMVATGIVAYGLLALAVVRGVPETVVVAAVAFFLVGATVGLFSELYTTARRKQGIAHDYGLATARLLTVPLLAGVAAIGGVLLTRLGATADSVPALSEVFSLEQYPFGLVVAAIFGLTPGLLLERLQKQTDAYREELAQTEKGEAAATPKD